MRPIKAFQNSPEELRDRPGSKTVAPDVTAGVRK
jgi:hypothetical protein